MACCCIGGPNCCMNRRGSGRPQFLSYEDFKMSRPIFMKQNTITLPLVDLTGKELPPNPLESCGPESRLEEYKERLKSAMERERNKKKEVYYY